MISMNSSTVCVRGIGRPGQRFIARATQNQVDGNEDGGIRLTNLSRRGLLSAAGGVAAVSAAEPSHNRAAQAGPLSQSCDVAVCVPPGKPMAKDLIPSLVIKGCWQLSGGHKGDIATDRTSGQQAINDFGEFMKAGISTFDTGPVQCGYGPSEELIGNFLASGGFKREEMQIFSKICCFGANNNPQFIKSALMTGLRRLRTSYIDVVQLYWNDYMNRSYVDAALYLQDLKSEGLIKHIGLTNFDSKLVAEISDNDVNILSNQVQYSLLDRRVENGMEKLCRERNISILPYGVLAGGFLSDNYLGLTPDKVALNTYSKQKYAAVLARTGGWEWLQSLLRVLSMIAKEKNASVANIATKWVLQNDVVPAVIIGARNTRHLADFAVISSFDLSEEDNNAIREILGRGNRQVGDCYSWERGGAF